MSAPPARRGRGDAVCTACALLCADIDPPAARRACPDGARAFAALQALPPAPDEAVVRSAAALLAGARRVLVTGLGEATLEGIAAACDLAESLGAAVDAGDPTLAPTTGPTIMRCGAVTAAYGELRDRADLVVRWFCDPTATHPRFAERFIPTHATLLAVGPPSSDTARRTTIGLATIDLATADSVAAARWLTARAAGIAVPATPLAEHLEPLADAVERAACVAVIVGEQEDDEGIAAWAVAEWVRACAHRKPAFAVPLRGGVGSASANAVGVAAVLNWRYGGPGAIARADRNGGFFRPTEADAVRLIGRGEVDAVLVVGRPRPRVAAALAGAREPPAIVQVASEPAFAGAMFLPVVDPLDEPGAMVRGDGEWVSVPGRRDAPPDRHLGAVLRSIRAVVEANADATPRRPGNAR